MAVSWTTAKSRRPAATCILLTCVILSPNCAKVARQPAPLAPNSGVVARAPGAGPDKSELTGYRVAYDLVADRVNAIAYLEGRMVIAAGGIDFYKFVDGNWKGSWLLGRTDGQARVAEVAGLSAAFSFPVDLDGDGVAEGALGDLHMTLVMRSLAPQQRLSVFVNEKSITTVDVGTERKAYDLTLPGAALVGGENRVRLTFRSTVAVAGGKRAAAAIEAISIGRNAGSAPLRALPPPSPHQAAGQAKLALSLPVASRLSYYLQVPAQARLALSYAGAAPGVTALVRVAVDGAAPKTLFQGVAPERYGDGTWDLGAFAGRAVRIDLVSRGGGIAWAEPRLLVPRIVETTPGKRTFDHVYVWMCDTLRADKVHVYNPKTNVITPNYDAFAREATRFAWAAVPGTWSLPSQASMLTGVYPNVHRATEQSSKIDPRIPIAAELFKKGGFRTALFSANGYVSSKWGFGRGFDENVNFVRENLPNRADYLWATAKKWVLPGKEKPQFVYLAVIEPHVIYNPRPEFLIKYWDKPYHGPIKPVLTGIQLGKIKKGTLKLNAVDKAYLEALHNGAITQSDAAFGVFLRDLKAAGLYDSSVIVVISDHGDEFWDHGDVGHAQAPHQELVHVPFMIRAPGLLPAGRVVDTDVEAMDLAPTMLELAGLPVPASMQGQSLVPVAFDEQAHSPSCGFTQNGSMARGLKSGRYRMIHAGPARIELYDEIDDPREQTNVVDKLPIALRQMRDVFSLQVGFENTWKKSLWGSPASPTAAFYTATGEAQ